MATMSYAVLELLQKLDLAKIRARLDTLYRLQHKGDMEFTRFDMAEAILKAVLLNRAVDSLQTLDDLHAVEEVFPHDPAAVRTLEAFITANLVPIELDNPGRLSDLPDVDTITDKVRRVLKKKPKAIEKTDLIRWACLDALHTRNARDPAVRTLVSAVTARLGAGNKNPAYLPNSYRHGIDLSAVRAAAQRFGFITATEGGDVLRYAVIRQISADQLPNERRLGLVKVSQHEVMFFGREFPSPAVFKLDSPEAAPEQINTIMETVYLAPTRLSWEAIAKKTGYTLLRTRA